MPHTSTSSIYKHGSFCFDCFQTRSPDMIDCLRLAQAAAESRLTILITGETGTGKNLLAQAIHNASPRSEKPSVVVNCTALSETLIESELFGHEKGAFTGADQMRKGRFELAHEGTLILDEIADMSLAAQAKILRAVEYGQFERLGGQASLQVDARVIALTNRPLDALVRQGSFREDLLYRLREFHIRIPPLRERAPDLPLLARSFLGEFAEKLGKDFDGFSKPAMDAMRCHTWPGNLREMKTVVRSAATLAGEGKIGPQHLNLVQPRAGDVSAEGPQRDPNVIGYTLRDAEAWQIARILRFTGGNKRQAARMLDIARNTLDKKLQDYGIDPTALTDADEPPRKA